MRDDVNAWLIGFRRRSGPKARTLPTRFPQRKRELLAIFLTVVSIVAVCLSLVGYGVALSAESVFGIPHALLFTSNFELLELSVWAVVHAVIAIPKIQLGLGYVKLLIAFFPFFLFIFLVTSGFVWVVRSGKPVAWFRRKTPNWLRGISQPPRAHDSGRSWTVKLALYSALMWVIIPLLPLAALVASVCALLLLVTAPEFGMQFGSIHLSRYVIAPKSCVRIQTQSERLSTAVTKHKTTDDQATCVRLANHQGHIASGRVAFATSSAVILFDPITGRVVRVPTKDVLVEAIDDLHTTQVTSTN